MADRRTGDPEKTPAVLRAVHTEGPLPSARKSDKTSGRASDTPVRQVARAVIKDIELKLDPIILSALHAAALNPDPLEMQRVLDDVLVSGARNEDLADFYIPAIAREMGTRWCEDQMSFAAVTIGVSRLQAMLHRLSANWPAEDEIPPTAPAIMLVVPQEAHHTLGAMVLGGQLRRRGYAVRLVLGLSAAEIAQLATRTGFDAVFVSAARGQALDPLRQIIETIRSVSARPPPIVLGGSLLDRHPVADLLALTGADFATQQPDEALRFCGLQLKKHPLSHFGTEV